MKNARAKFREDSHSKNRYRGSNHNKSYQRKDNRTENLRLIRSSIGVVIRRHTDTVINKIEDSLIVINKKGLGNILRSSANKPISFISAKLRSNGNITTRGRLTVAGTTSRPKSKALSKDTSRLTVRKVEVKEVSISPLDDSGSVATWGIMSEETSTSSACNVEDVDHSEDLSVCEQTDSVDFEKSEEHKEVEIIDDCTTQESTAIYIDNSVDFEKSEEHTEVEVVDNCTIQEPTASHTDNSTEKTFNQSTQEVKSPKIIEQQTVEENNSESSFFTWVLVIVFVVFISKVL